MESTRCSPSIHQTSTASTAHFVCDDCASTIATVGRACTIRMSRWALHCRYGHVVSRSQHIHNGRTYNASLVNDSMPGDRIVIVQSLANHEPDVDAIFRLTQEHRLPLNFSSAYRGTPLVLPTGTLAPLNAQACLYKYAALWMLLLPITVHGRVADIWRGYIGQRLLWDTDRRVAFTDPAVVQIRNAHNNLADFNAEIPLYEKVPALIARLHEWKSSSPTLPGRIEELWIDMYERDYIGINDVHFCQAWLYALIDVGYQFPNISSKQTEIIATEPTEQFSTLLNSTLPVRLNIWTSDLHDGTRADLPSTFMRLGHNITECGRNWALSSYPVWIMVQIG
ncbi:unnamed protein product [Sphagnum balticum]